MTDSEDPPSDGETDPDHGGPNPSQRASRPWRAVASESERSTAPVVAVLHTTRPVAGRWAILSVAAFLGFFYGFAWIVATFEGRSLEPIYVAQSAMPSGPETVALLVGVIALVAIPHELLHGVAMARYGGRTRYGVQLARFVFPYAYVETRHRYRRNQMLVVACAPFVVLSAVGIGAALVLEASWPLVLAAVNGAGSVGDLWLACRLLQYPSTVRVGPAPAGEDGGVGVYASDAVVSGPANSTGREPGNSGSAGLTDSSPPESVGSDSTGSTGSSRAVLTWLSGAVWTYVALVGVFVVLVFASLGFDSGAVRLGDPDGPWFLFRHERAGTQGALIEVGTPLIVALACLGGVIWATLERWT